MAASIKCEGARVRHAIGVVENGSAQFCEIFLQIVVVDGRVGLIRSCGAGSVQGCIFYRFESINK